MLALESSWNGSATPSAEDAPRSLGAARRVPGSFRDPAGFLFWRDGDLFRQVNRSCASDYDHLMASGLYAELVNAGLLVPHEESDERACEPRRAYKVLRPRRVPLVSYPYEWCFGHLKDAALATLRIQKLALARGMWLKDASAYNMQLLDGRQTLIDTLSLEQYPEGRPWVAYRQFCQHFLAPLALMARCDVRLGGLLREHIDGIPLDLAARLLPFRTRFLPGLGLHVHAHARGLRKHAAAEQMVAVPKRKLSRRSLELVIDSLRALVQSLNWKPGKSTWRDYYRSMHNYSGAAMERKRQVVDQLLEQARPRTVWDLGANDGRFSRLASGRGVLAVSWDVDPACVERNYQAMRRDGETHIVPLLLDLTNPSPALGWAHEERLSLADRGGADVVMALGLIHHLAISNNVPLGRIAALLARLGRRLIIEWVPKEDSQVQKWLATREDVFGGYHRRGFEAALGRYFDPVSATEIGGTSRCISYWKRSPAP